MAEEKTTDWLAEDAKAKRADTIATIVRAVGAAAAAFAALQLLAYFSLPVNAVLAGAVGILMLISTTGAVALYLGAIAIPVVHANALIGIIMLVIGFAALKLMSERNGAWFFVLALATVAARFKVTWAIPLLAGFYLGGTEGFVGALAACLLLEVLAVMLGIDVFGLALPPVRVPLFKPTPGPGFSDFSWVIPQVLSMANIQRTIKMLSRAFSKNPAMIAQPVAWGAIATVAGLALKDSFKRVAPIAVGLMLALAALMAAIGTTLARGQWSTQEYTLAALAGLLLVLPWSAAALALAKARHVKPEGAAGAAFAPAVAPGAPITVNVSVGASGEPAPAAGVAAPIAETAVTAAASMQTQQDIADLLRTIAEAQDVIKEKFTQNATVLLTDMKEFTKLTHEQGNVPGAATVQRCRDLLEPIIEKHRGQGRPTGGDGMLAAFAAPDDAIEAAIDMQRALDSYNTEHPSANPILIRIGLDTGEVVFDKDSNPFIGDALNLASRIMNLADEGQIFISKNAMEAAEHSAQLAWHFHGTRKLRGISEDVGIYEILWADGQEPRAPDSKRL